MSAGAALVEFLSRQLEMSFDSNTNELLLEELEELFPEYNFTPDGGCELNTDFEDELFESFSFSGSNKKESMESLFPEINFHSIRGSRELEHIEMMNHYVPISDSLFSLFSSPLADQTDAEHKQRVVDIALDYGAAAPRLVCTPGVQFSKKEHNATRVPCDAKLYYYTNDPILKRVADEALPDHCVCEGGEGNSHHRGCRVLGYYHCACSRWWLSATTWYKSDTRRIGNAKICRGCEEKVFPWQFTPTLNALEVGSDNFIAGSASQALVVVE